MLLEEYIESSLEIRIKGFWLEHVKLKNDIEATYKRRSDRDSPPLIPCLDDGGIDTANSVGQLMKVADDKPVRREIIM